MKCTIRSTNKIIDNDSEKKLSCLMKNKLT